MSDPNEQIFNLFGQVLGALHRSRRVSWLELDLTMAQLKVLATLHREGSLPTGALAERLQVSPPSITRQIDRLVRGGWVIRHRSEDDRRVVVVILTEKGRRLMQALSPCGAPRQLLARALERMAPRSREDLLRGLAALHEALQDVTSCGHHNSDERG